MKIELEDSDIERIATALAAKIGGAAPAATEEKAPKNAKKTEEKKTAPAESKDDAEAIQKRRGEVLAKVKALGEKIGRDNAKAIVSKFAPTMGEVKPADFDALEKELDAAAAPKSEDDDY